MTHEERLKEYVKNDIAYQEYKTNNKKHIKEYTRLCFSLSRDIEWALGEIKHLRELQKSMDQQYEELEQENKQLCNEIDIWNDKYNAVDRDRNKYKSILDEIREECNSVIGNPEHTIVSKNQLMKIVLQILDKAKNDENN